MKLPVVDKLLVLSLLLTVTLATSAQARNEPKGGHGGGQRVSHGVGSRVTFRGGHGVGYSQSHVARGGHFRSPGAASTHRTASRSSGYRPQTASAESAMRRSAVARGSRRATTNEVRTAATARSRAACRRELRANGGSEI